MDSLDTTPVTLPAVNALVSQMPLADCWAGSIYLGSMFVLDFGGRLVVQRKSRGPVEVGETSLSIRDVYWVLQAGGHELTNAEAVNAEVFSATVRPAFIGSSLARIDALPDAARIAFRFSNFLDLIVDTSDMWQSGDTLVEISLMNGRFLQLMSGGDWVTSDERDQTRLRAFESGIVG